MLTGVRDVVVKCKYAAQYTVQTSDDQHLLRDDCVLISQTAVFPYTPMKTT